MGNGCSAYSMEGVQSDCVPEKIPLTQLGCVRGIYLYQKALELTCREVRRGRCPHRPGSMHHFYGTLRRIRSCPWGDVGIAPYAIHGGFTQRRGHFLYLHRAYLHTSNRIRKEGGCVQPPSHSRIERTYLASTEMTSRPL